MKWIRNIIIGFGFFSLAFVSLLLSSSCYAIDWEAADFQTDVDWSFDSPSIPQAGTFCNNNTSDPVNCFDEEYFVIEIDSPDPDCFSSGIWDKVYTLPIAISGISYNFPILGQYSTVFPLSPWNQTSGARMGFYGVAGGDLQNDLADCEPRLYFGLFSSYDAVFGDGVSGITPSGSISITQNGTYDVTNYASASVNVPNTETVIQGDYHDDLVSIKVGIYICAGTILVLYFFYCIYRLIIRNSGVK